MQDRMLFKRLMARLHGHAKIYHHHITSHPHYELIAGHAIESIAIIGGFFLAIGFGSTGSLPINESFIYPLQTISHPDCKFEDFDTLGGDCLIDLPRIKQADFDAYRDDPLVRGVYSVLRSSSYDDGWDHRGGHSGTDFRTSRGTPVVSIGDGKVVDAGRNVGYGNVVKIKYLTPEGETIYAIYAHLDMMTVETDKIVKKGEKVGEVGDTGLAYGVHLHYEIDTTTRRGKPLYPYLYCEEQNPYLHNNTDICIDLLYEHTDDPVAFHEEYFSTLVASVDSTVPNTADDQSEETASDEKNTDITENNHPSAPEDEEERINTEKNDQISPITTTVEPVIVDTNDQALQTIYDIIQENIPDLDVGTLSTDAQEFLRMYGIEIKHIFSPTTQISSDVTVELYIYNKATKEPLTGSLPAAIALVAANDNIRVLPSTIDYIHHGRAVIRLRGAQPGPSIIGFTIDDSIFYALPVLVE